MLFLKSLPTKSSQRQTNTKSQNSVGNEIQKKQNKTAPYHFLNVHIWHLGSEAVTVWSWEVFFCIRLVNNNINHFLMIRLFL